MIRRALVTTTALLIATSAVAQDRIVPNPSRRVQETVLVDPTTGAGISPGAADADQTGSGTLNAATLNQTYTFPLTGARSTVGMRVSGLTASGATITVEGSNDGGTTWSNANTTASNATSSLSATLTADDQFRVGVAGRTNLRLRVSSVGTGTISIAYQATSAAGAVFQTSLLPSTTNAVTGVIGGVDNVRVGGVAVATGAGTTTTGVQRVVLPTDQSAVPTQGFTGFNDANTGLAANASTTATQRTPPTWASYFGCRAFQNQTGTLSVGETVNGGAQLTIASQAVAVNTAVDLNVRVRGSGTTYYCVLTNGSTASTVVSVESSFTAN